MENQDKYTDIWKKYEKSKEYLRKKNLISDTDRNWNFYKGDQWAGIKAGNEELPLMNFIKPTVNYKVAVICQNKMTAVFSDLDINAENENLCKALNKAFTDSWEKGNMDTKHWEVVLAGAVQGESYLYWGAETNKAPQLLDNTTVLLGDENITDVQKQPYILIVERLNVEDVREIAKENNIKDIDLIVGDDKRQEQIGNKDEVTDKVTSILYMTKKNGVVYVAKSTKQCIYEPERAIQATKNGSPYGVGLRSYPLVNFVWEKQPNSARGVSEVKQMIPNQLELNKTLARRSMTVKLTAFPRIAYDESMVSNPEDLDNVGVPIAVNGGGAGSINQMISYLNATSMSSDADKLSDYLLNVTRDLAGAGDYATGNVNPEQASGAAIIATRDQAQLPLNKQMSQDTQCTEDIAMVWFDMWAYDPDANNIPSEVAKQLENFKPSVKIDVCTDNAWSKMGEQQWVDQLFEKGLISLEEYVDLCPDGSVVPKSKLKKMFEKRKGLIDGTVDDLPDEPTEEELAEIPPEYLGQEEEASQDFLSL